MEVVLGTTDISQIVSLVEIIAVIWVKSPAHFLQNLDFRIHTIICTVDVVCRLFATLAFGFLETICEAKPYLSCGGLLSLE